MKATTIADIARLADVPPGNVHYYFKTRDEIVAAVIEAQNERTRQWLAGCGRRRTPAARLKALADEFAAYREMLARHGCPIGSLCSELDKIDPRLAGDAAVSLQLMVDWASEQFQAMGRRDASDLSIELIARYEGAALLANTFGDSDLILRQTRSIKRWIDGIARGT